MTQTKATKRALLMSIMSIFICLTMLIGSTFAWFTDTATTGVNTIKSGNLDVELEMSYDDGTTWLDAENKTLEFRNANGSSDILWEPGAEFKLPQLRIRNNGNLALKYKVVVSGLTGDMMLANVLDVNLSVNGAAKNTVGTLTQVMALNAAEVDGIIHGELAASKTSSVYEVSLKMQEGANNDYMNKTLSGLYITVYATQDDVEWDSWSNDYDAGATYSDEATIVEGVPVVLHSSNTSVSIPANTLPAGQVVKLQETSAENSETAKAVVTVDDTLIAAKDISIVDADGNEVTMPDGNYTVTMDIGTGLDASSLAVYHKEEKIESINYNSSSGTVTFTTNSFSPFTVIYENIGTIDSAAKLVAVRDSVNAGDTKAGIVYNVTKDIDLSGVEWTAISNFAGTFNGQGYTISNMTANLFGTVSGTVKNVNVENVTVTNTAKNGANGFISAVAEGGLVDNCKVSNVSIEWAAGKGTTDCYGGVISRVSAGATVKNSKFSNVAMTADRYVKRSGAVFAEVTGTISGCTIDGVTLNVADNYSGKAYTNQVGAIIADLYQGSVVSDCTINNVTLVVDDEGSNTGGIIGKVYVTGTAGPNEISIKNITVNGLTMNVGNTVHTKWSTLNNVGGFIGQMDSRNNDSHLTMDNCHIYNLDMTLASNLKGEDPSAGFISSLNGGADITNCSVSGKINGTNEPIGVGGFLGCVGGYGANNDYVINIANCSADVAITDNDNIFVGGFVAYAGSYNQTMTKSLALNFTNCEATDSFYGVKDTNETEVSTFTGCKVNGADFNG